jgi:serine/threonine protein kinase
MNSISEKIVNNQSDSLDLTSIIINNNISQKSSKKSSKSSKKTKNESEKTSSSDDDSDDDSDEDSSEDSSDESDDCSDESSDYIDKTKGDDNLGLILNGNYVLIEKIGYGTFSCVWLAYKMDDSTGKHFYAIKVQHPEDYQDGFKEAKYLETIKKLNCPNLIYMYESFTFTPPQKKDDKTKKEFNPSVCMVFDLLVGSVYQMIKKGRTSSSSTDKTKITYEDGLNEKIVAKIISQTANALNVIKEKIQACHTDIKPENILIKGTDKRLKIFMEKFLEENFCKKLKIMTDKIISDFKLNLSNKKHKLRFAKIKREVAKKIIISINNNINTYIEKTHKISKDSKIFDIDENIQVVLADFGTIKPFCKVKYDDDIQTRYYRSPEVILMCNYDHKADVWSLACTAYELLTGSLLFDPEKDKHHSTDYHHIYWIMELLGDIPKSLLSKAKNASDFFHSSGKFKEKKPELHPLSVIFKDDVEIECSSNMIFLLEKMLAISPNDRFDYNDIINYIHSNY